MDKFELNINDAHSAQPEKANRHIVKKDSDYSSFEFAEKAYFYCAVADNEITEFYFANGDEITVFHSFDTEYSDFVKSFLKVMLKNIHITLSIFIALLRSLEYLVIMFAAI